MGAGTGLLVLALAFPVAGIACGGDDAPDEGATSGGTGSFGAPVPLEDMSDVWSAAVCGKLFECCAATGAGGGGAYTEEECREEMAEDLAVLEAWVLGAIERGTVRYDGQVARACVAAIEVAACADLGGGDFRQTHPACAGLFEGLVDVGGACELGAECQSGHCKIDLLGGGDGTCFTPPALGEACTGACAEGSACEDAVCVAPRPDGANCSSDDACASGACEPSGDAGVCVADELCDF